jgi:molybdopterin-containing oxidoreductase family iron-sulfur binding subunit
MTHFPAGRPSSRDGLPEGSEELMKTDEKTPKELTRAQFLKLGGAGLAAIAAGGLAQRALAKENPGQKATRRQWAMVIDLTRCIGCEACTVACQQENNTPPAPHADVGRMRAWNQVVFNEEGKTPFAKIKYHPRPCFHCEHPSCVKVCPVGATYRDEKRGIVLVDYARCIGCRYCAANCPYGARYFNWSKPEWSKNRGNASNPGVPMRPKGVIEKCTFCIQRIRAAEERAAKEGREIRDGEVVPACNQTCMGRARFFGDLNDPNSQVSKLVRSGRAYRLAEHYGNEPNVYYLAEVRP